MPALRSSLNNMKIGIVVLNYNGKIDTLACLDSITNLDADGFEINTVVVDNASSDDSVTAIRAAYPNLTVIINQENLGFAGGNNVGIRELLKRQMDFILILNNDTKLAKICLSELLKAAENEKRGGVFGPKIYFSPGREFHKQKYHKRDEGKIIWYAGGKIDWANLLASHRGVDEVDVGQYQEMIKTQFVTGCALFVRSTVFKNVGLFDAKLYLYFEDIDFCKRAQKKNWDIWYVPKAILWHNNAGSTGGAGSDLQTYYFTRNRLLIGMRYAPWKTKLALFREATRMLMKGNRTQKQAVGDFLRKKYGRR